MNSFKDFIIEFKNNPSKLLPGIGSTLLDFQKSLSATIVYILEIDNVSWQDTQKSEIAEKISNVLIKDDEILSNFSTQLGEPAPHDSEEMFVNRGTQILRQILYRVFDIKDTSKQNGSSNLREGSNVFESSKIFEELEM